LGEESIVKVSLSFFEKVASSAGRFGVDEVSPG
jgi:hypothetical protein